MKISLAMTKSAGIKSYVALCLFTALSTSTGACGKKDKGPAEITISCGSVGQDFDSCKAGVEAWEKKSGNKAKLVASPASSTDALALYQQLLAAGASDIDILRIDVVWPGTLGGFLLDLTPYTKGAEKNYFESMIANDMVGGH